MAANWYKDVLQSQNPYYGLGSYSETPTSEQFNYQSFNPSLGISYLPFAQLNAPLKDLNVFFNWSQGTRTPSSVELGCAYDNTLVEQNPGAPDSPKIRLSTVSSCKFKCSETSAGKACTPASMRMT